MNVPPLDYRDVAILQKISEVKGKPSILNVGAGKGRIDYHLEHMDFTVFSTDIYSPEDSYVRIFNLNIFDSNTYPSKPFDIVLCSEVLEHLKDWKIALKNLIRLAGERVIITVPWRKSCNSPDHVNYWDDKVSGRFKTVQEFYEVVKPHNMTVEKIYTKEADKKKNKMCYLITITKDLK